MTLVAALVLSAGSAWAALMSGGDYTVEATLVSPAGGSATGADYEARIAAGDPALGLAASAGSPDATWSFISAYLSGIRPGSLLGPAVEGLSAAQAILVGDVPVGLPLDGTLRIRFSNDMLDTTIVSSSAPGAFLVTAVRDAQLATVSIVQGIDVAYDELSRSAVISPSTAWTPGARLTVLVSSNVADVDQIQLAGGAAFEVEVARDPDAPNVAAAPFDTGLKVDLPPGAFDVPYSVFIGSSPSGPEIDAASAKLALALGQNPLRVLEFEARSTSGGVLSSLFRKPVRLLVPYADADSDGIVDGTPFRSSSLSLWRLDEASRLWVRVPDSRVEAGRLAATLRSFSVYALAGGLTTDVSQVYAFPVPFRPNAGDPARYGSDATGIRFVNLPDEGRIRVYDVSGRRVREIAFGPGQPPAPLSWNVRDDDGAALGSGVYVWEIVSGGNRKTGKLMVVR